MALSEDLPVYKVTVKLLDRLTDLQPNLPRMVRYHHGDQMIDICIDMLVLIRDANRSADKQAFLDQLLSKQHRLLLILRVCFRQKAFSTGKYAELLEPLESIGKQVTQWRKKSKSNG